MSSFWPSICRRSILLAAFSLCIGLILSSCNPRPVAVATATPPPSPIPAATAFPAAVAPSPVSRVAVARTPTPLPAGVSPFTGLKASDPRVLDRMPAAVKISNSPIVRPQSGLSRADVVVEHLAEGGITRFTAIYHSQEAERIGSVRSARLIDLELPVLFDAFLVYSGASGEVSRLLEWV